MNKQKVLVLIPVVITGAFLTYTCCVILFTDVCATWRHYLSLICFLVLIYILTKNNFKKSLFAATIFLIAGTTNLFVLTPSITSHSYGITVAGFTIATPPFQLLSFLIFILFCILNFNALADAYLDYKEIKEQKKNR